MRSEIRTALAVIATAAVLMGSATMALAADGDGNDPDPVETTVTTTSPTATEPTDTTDPTDSPTSPDPTETTPTDPEPIETEPTETTPTPTPTENPTDVPDGAFTVSNALFRWGINNESNNRAAAPGTFNFFSAGKLANPGAGGQLLTDASAGARWANGRAAGWKASSGHVRIEKRQANGSSYALGTWSGLKTDKDGETLGGYASNTVFSDHQVVLRGGTGQVDVAAKSATIAWKGDFTIVYYSGYSFFYVSDPKLTVTNGQGKITATLGGYASSMDDMTQWNKIADTKDVVIADLGAVDLSKDLGFTATPKYLGVRVTGADQNTSGSFTGSFPQSFINFTKKIGIAGYWYSTGGGIDKNKPALPLAVSYDAGKPVVPPSSSDSDSDSDDDGSSDDIDNSAPTAPSTTAPPSVTQPAGPALPSTAASVPAPGTDDVLQAGDAFTPVKPVSTVVGFKAASSSDSSSSTGIWILGGALLASALMILASPYVYTALRKD